MALRTFNDAAAIDDWLALNLGIKPPETARPLMLATPPTDGPQLAGAASAG
jgi:hypothetical protein